MSLLNASNGGAAAEFAVAYRFLEAGRIPSWPLVSCAYDLIVDGGDVLYRVQVKKAHRPADSNAWWVHLTKKPQHLVRATAYDILCVVCDINTCYVIPAAALRHPENPQLLLASLAIYPARERFAAYLNQFGLGHAAAQPPVEVTRGVRHATAPPVVTATRQTNRKAHRRLSTEQAQELLRLPIYVGWGKLPPGMLSVQQAAQQFNISSVTVLNLLQRRRKDLAIS